MKPRAVWQTRFGFYFAAIGTAFGLGNLWRFPYVVSENGGGAFVLLYIFLVFVVGTPLLLSELLLGKITRKSIVLALQSEPESPLPSKMPLYLQSLNPYIGPLVTIVSLIILSYFAVISGWVFYFFIHFLLISLGFASPPLEISMTYLRDHGWLQFLLAGIHLFSVTIIVARGIEKGIERWVGYMIPVFALLLLALVIQSLSLDTSVEALRYFFYPDFSRLNYSSLGDALGHVLFTLSIGFGTMVTFGSYLRKKTLVSTAGFRVAIMDSCVSLFSGLIIFPLVIMGVSTSMGPELLFHTVPILLSHLSGGAWFGVAFFLCLYLSALGASIGLLESVVANIKDVTHLKRSSASIYGGVACTLIAILPSLSSSLLSEVKWGSRGLLEIFDKALINWALPLLALLLSQIIHYKLNDEQKRREFMNEESKDSLVLYAHWLFALKWVVPSVILLAFLLQTIGLFTS